MKKIIAMLMGAGLLASVAQADLLVSDDFSYTGRLTNNGWVAYSGADGSITADGNVATMGAVGAEDIRLAFADQGTDPVYASFTLNIASLPATGGEYSWGFSDNTIMDSRYGIVSEASGNEFGLALYGTGSAVLGTVSGLSLNTDYLVTMYFDGVNDHRLWLNPTSTEFATPALQGTGAQSGIDGFFIRQAGALDNGASEWTMDDLTVATTFAEVVPEPGTLALMAVGMIGLAARRRRMA